MEKIAKVPTASGGRKSLPAEEDGYIEGLAHVVSAHSLPSPGGCSRYMPRQIAQRFENARDAGLAVMQLVDEVDLRVSRTDGKCRKLVSVLVGAPPMLSHMRSKCFATTTRKDTRDHYTNDEIVQLRLLTPIALSWRPSSSGRLPAST